MQQSPSVDEQGVVARLRAAGCVFAEDEAALLVSAATGPEQLAIAVDRRVRGEPLEHVLGWAEFGGLRVAVDPGVFVPRRRTQFLAERAAELATELAKELPPELPTEPTAELAARPTVEPGGQSVPVVLVDLCCGSGAIGALVAARLAARGLGVQLYAADSDPVAVGNARRNLAAAQVSCGDLYQALPDAIRGRVDVLVANVPYVPTDAIATMPAEARLHEPAACLDGGNDGLDVVRRLSAGAQDWLGENGVVLVETSPEQAPVAAATFARGGLQARIEQSAQHHATAVIAVRPRPNEQQCEISAAPLSHSGSRVRGEGRRAAPAAPDIRRPR